MKSYRNREKAFSDEKNVIVKLDPRIVAYYSGAITLEAYVTIGDLMKKSLHIAS
jgi:hypothetical protein